MMLARNLAILLHVRGVLSQVRATNADVDNVGELLASESLPLAAADLLGELLHVVQDLVDATRAVHDILTLDLHVPSAHVSQSSVEDGTVLGEVDLVSAEHGITLALDAGLLGQLDEEVQGLICEEVLAEVEEDVGGGVGAGGEGAGEAGESVGVGGEGLLEDEALADTVAVGLELRPSGKSVCGSHGQGCDISAGGG